MHWASGGGREIMNHIVHSLQFTTDRNYYTMGICIEYTINILPLIQLLSKKSLINVEYLKFKIERKSNWFLYI